MNSAEHVGELIAKLKADGAEKPDIVWKTALACVGWPYVFGAWGSDAQKADTNPP